MATFWKRGRDTLHNGSILGVLFGLLLASSSVSWIQSIVETIVNIIPVEYHFQYISYLVFGIIGFGIGYFIDRS